MKKDEKPSRWKEELLSGLGEIIFMLCAALVTAGVMMLFPYELVKDVFDVFFFFICIILIVIIGAVIFIVDIVRKRKKNKDIRFIYKTLKDKYKLVMMTLTRRVDEEMVDVVVIRGKSSDGKFELFKLGNEFHFVVEYFTDSREGISPSTSLSDINEAIECIEKFMSVGEIL